MTEEDLDIVLDKALDRAFTRLGLNMDDHLSVQQDMAFLRSWRKSSDTAYKHGLVTVITLFIAGGLGLLWQAVKN